MSSLKLSLLLSMVVLISACSQFRPFEDRRREPGSAQIYVGTSKPESPVICYNPIFYKVEDLKGMADDLCQAYDKDTIAEYKSHDIFSCRLFVPSRAYYACTKKK